MIGITLGAGAAVFGWVNSQAGTSENALGQSSAKQANYYEESFVIVSVQFSDSGPSCQVSSGQTYCNVVSIAVYNNGEVGLTINSITFSNSSWKSISGAIVPKMYVALNLPTPLSTKYSMQYICGSTSGSSSSASPSQPVARESVPPTVYTFTLPASCPTSSGILDGASYTIQLTGLYGNVVTSEVTANG